MLDPYSCVAKVELVLIGKWSGGGEREVQRETVWRWLMRKGERLAAAEPEFHGACWDKAMAGRIDDGEFARSERKSDELGSVGGQVDALETDEGTDWGAIDVGMRNVEFDDFIAGDAG